MHMKYDLRRALSSTRSYDAHSNSWRSSQLADPILPRHGHHAALVQPNRVASLQARLGNTELENYASRASRASPPWYECK